MFASAAFATNIALWLQSGYFDIEFAKKRLLHLWSLGIEEQFYLIWPLILMLAARLRLNLLTVALAVGLASFVLNVALIDTNRVATFYLGAEFIWAWDLLCNADGCLTRIGEEASDISASDQVHLTETGSIFLVRSVIGQILGTSAANASFNRGG